jgi:two-component sensor histidine kinase
VEDFFFEMDCAIPLGIIVNELVSNSLKHAFPDGKSGEICIELHREDYDKDEILSNCNVGNQTRNNSCPCKYFTLVVKDNGIGFPESIDYKNTNSLGLQLVNTLVDQIDGSIEFKKGPETRFTILIPVFQSMSRNKTTNCNLESRVKS